MWKVGSLTLVSYELKTYLGMQFLCQVPDFYIAQKIVDKKLPNHQNRKESAESLKKLSIFSYNL